MKQIEENVRSIEMDGLLWGVSKFYYQLFDSVHNAKVKVQVVLTRFVGIQNLYKLPVIMPKILRQEQLAYFSHLVVTSINSRQTF